MAAKTPKILLIAASPMSASFLTERLKEWACEIHFASSCKEAKTFVSNHRFDLVLGEFGLRDELVVVVAGCQGWSTMLGSLAMRPSEFIGFLDNVLKDIRSRQPATSGKSRAPSY
jgi:CheY-like chemotaxis protein